MSLKSVQSEALQHLNFQKDCEEMVASSLERGLQEWPGIYKKALEDIKRELINIGVTGSSGAGKSSWINSMCDFKRGSSGQYAATDVIECTKEIKAYRHPQIENVWFWDMPGNNTPDCPHETYLKQVKFEQYDALIIITKDRFTEGDLYLAKAAKEHGIPYYFVYSQFDFVIFTTIAMDTNETEEELKKTIARKIRTELEKAEIRPQKIYFLSNVSKLGDKYDFPELKTKIMKDTQQNNNNKVRKLKTCLQQMCKKKIDENLKLVRGTNICVSIMDGTDVRAFGNLENLAHWFVFRDVHSQQSIKNCLVNIERWSDEIRKIDRSLLEGIAGTIGGVVGGGAGGAIGAIGVAGEVAAVETGAVAAASVAGGAIGTIGVVGEVAAIKTGAVAAASVAGGAAVVGAIAVAGVGIGITHLINKQKKTKLTESILREYDEICGIIECEAKKFEDQYIDSSCE